MTIEETILSFPGLSDFSPLFLEHILKARALNGASEGSVENSKLINLAIADTLKFAVNMPDFTENKLGVKYPRSYFYETASILYRENGEPEKAENVEAINRKKKKIVIKRGQAPKSW